ncbi:MAG: hypothetical protein ACRD09_04165 [Vicinamibacterales bacterium]
MAQSTTFRKHEAEARPSVKTFYQLNHRHQTFDFVRQKEAEYLLLNRKPWARGRRSSS